MNCWWRDAYSTITSNFNNYSLRKYPNGRGQGRVQNSKTNSSYAWKIYRKIRRKMAIFVDFSECLPLLYGFCERLTTCVTTVGVSCAIKVRLESISSILKYSVHFVFSHHSIWGWSFRTGKMWLYMQWPGLRQANYVWPNAPKRGQTTLQLQKAQF